MDDRIRIKNLEADNAKLNEAYNDMYREVCRKNAQVEDLRRHLNRLEKERDAAVADLKCVLRYETVGEIVEECWWCKGNCKQTDECKDLSCWEWRGVKEEQ